VTDIDPHEMPFLDHLEELRKRLIKSGASCVIGSIIGWFFVDKVIDVLAKLVGQVYFMAPTEAFMIRLKLSIIIGIMVSVPVITYQLWKFVAPGLYMSERRLVVPVVAATTLFFLIGASFCYFVVLPAALKFLMGYGTANMTPLISIGSLLSFCAYMILAFGVVFELPVLSFFLGRIGIISYEILKKWRRYAVIAALVLGAVLTPPDVFSQAMLAGPLLVLFELSIWVVKFTGKKRREDTTYDEDEREIGRAG
jgi:sec-independent protein translocase protein TatC